MEVSYKEQNYDHADHALQKLSDYLFFKEDPVLSSIFWLDIDLYFIGDENHSQRNYKGALRAFTALVDVFPQSKFVKLATYRIGETNYNLEEYKTSRKSLEKFLTFPDSDLKSLKSKAQRLIAQSYLDQSPKDYHQAYLNFDKLTTAEFENDTDLISEAMYKAAYCLKELKENDEALGRYAEFMTLFPGSKDITNAYFDLGSLYADNKKDYELARFNYNRALQSPESPNHSKAEIQLQIGGTYYVQGNFEKAGNAYKLLLQEYPENEQVLRARVLIAYIHRRAKRTDEAIRTCESLIADYTDKKPVYFSYYMDDGLLLWNNLIALSYYEIGQTFSVKKDFKQAFNSYARIVKKPDGEDVDFRKDPIAPFALHKAMIMLCKLDRKDELKPFATIYIKSLGDINVLSDDQLILSAEAQLKFADVLREELQDYSKAATEYAKLQKYPPIQHLRLELIKLRGKYYEGQCYEKVSTSDKSVEAYQEVIRLYDSIFRPLVDNPHIDVPSISEAERNYFIRTARYYVGNSYFATNQFKEAIAEFEEFLKIVEFEEFLKIVKPEAGKFKEMIKTARDKIEKARQLGAKAKRPKSSSDVLDKLGSSEKSKNEKPLLAQDIAEIASGSTVFIKIAGILEYESGKVEIKNKVWSGSGFFVDHGQIVTNYHVIKTEPSYTFPNKYDGKDEVVFARPLGKRSVRLIGTDREYAIVGYTAVDPDRDLAILKVRAFGVKPLSLGDSENVNQGDAVYPVGNPTGLVNVVSDGQISSIQWIDSIRKFFNKQSKLVSDVQREDAPHKLLMMTAPISRGSSGGPVLDSNGKVIGISVGSTMVGQNLNYAVPVNYLKALLNRTGPPKPLNDLEIVY